MLFVVHPCYVLFFGKHVFFIKNVNVAEAKSSLILLDDRNLVDDINLSL